MLGAFAKRYAALGVNREAIQTNKQNQYEETIQVCRSFTFSPSEFVFMKNKHTELQKTAMAMMKKKGKKQKPA